MPSLLLIAALTATALTACGADASDGSGVDGSDSTVLTVAAASSLTDAFEAIAEEFEATHPEVEVRLTFDSSGTLATQALEGAPIDVLATADEESMAPVVDAGLVEGETELFAGNLLTIVTRADAPDVGPYGPRLGEVEVLALCASTAPCGRIADRRLEALMEEGTLSEDRITRAPNARATLAAVLDGDADAAIVFATDAHAAGDRVRAFELGMDEQSPDTMYPIATLAESAEPELARAFVDLVLSDEGRDALRAQGFWLIGEGFAGP
jgi:molybdate transport system substrate-binding protein